MERLGRMERRTAHDINELIRRAELRLEQYIIARDLARSDSACALAMALRVNASLAMIVYLRSLLEQRGPARQPAWARPLYHAEGKKSASRPTKQVHDVII
jgi:hypothetical protein